MREKSCKNEEFSLFVHQISKEDAAGEGGGGGRGKFAKIENNREPNILVSSSCFVVDVSTLANEQTKPGQPCGLTLGHHLHPRVL